MSRTEQPRPANGSLTLPAPMRARKSITGVPMGMSLGVVRRSCWARRPGKESPKHLRRSEKLSRKPQAHQHSLPSTSMVLRFLKHDLHPLHSDSRGGAASPAAVPSVSAMKAELAALGVDTRGLLEKSRTDWVRQGSCTVMRTKLLSRSQKRSGTYLSSCFCPMLRIAIALPSFCD